jgi:hypothetical protein
MILFDLNKLKSLDYWFAGATGSYVDVPLIDKSSPFFYFYINLFSVLFIFGLLLCSVSLFTKNTFPLIKKLSVWGVNFSWMGVLGMFWFSLREIKTAFFGARFWLVIGLIWFLTILYFIIRYFVFYFNIERKYYLSKTNLKNIKN